MKKNYIKPTSGKAFMDVSSLMTASVKHVSETEAAEGTSGGTVNLGRESNGSFWDDVD